MKWLLSLLLCVTLHGQEWSRTDTLYETGCVATLALDWGQTLCIQSKFQDRPCLTERNSVIGHRPSRAVVNRYFGAVVLGHVLTAALLPSRYRRTFQGATLGLELAVIGRNYQLGFSVTF